MVIRLDLIGRVSQSGSLSAVLPSASLFVTATDSDVGDDDRAVMSETLTVPKADIRYDSFVLKMEIVHQMCVP